jgi:hypothetical protein
MTQIGLTTYVEVIKVTPLVSSFSLSNTILGVSRWQNPGNRFDVLGDGVVDINDYNTISNYITTHGTGSLPKNRPSNQPYVDVNGDGIVDNKDLTQMLKYLQSKNLIDNSPTKAYNISDIKIERDLVNPANVSTVKDVAAAQNIFPLNNYLVYNRNLATNDLTETTYAATVASRDSLVFVNIDAIIPVHPYTPGCYNQSCVFRIIKDRIAAAEILPIRFNKTPGATGVAAGNGLPLPGTDTSAMPVTPTVVATTTKAPTYVEPTTIVSDVTQPEITINDIFPNPCTIIGEISLINLSIDGADNPSTTACTAKMTSNTTPLPYVVSADSEAITWLEKWFYTPGAVTDLCAGSDINGTWLIQTSEGQMNYDSTTLNEVAVIALGAGATVISATEENFASPPDLRSYSTPDAITILCKNSGLPGASSINSIHGQMNYDTETINKAAFISLGSTVSVTNVTEAYYTPEPPVSLTYNNPSAITALCANSGLPGASSINTSSGQMRCDSATLDKIAKIALGSTGSVSASTCAYYTPNPPVTAYYDYAGNITRICINSGLPGSGNIVPDTDGDMRNDPATCLKFAQIVLGPTATYTWVKPGDWTTPGDNYLSYWNGSQFICGNARDLGNNMIDGITITRPGDTHYLSYWDGSKFVCVTADSVGNNMINTITVSKPGVTHYLSYWDGSQFVCVTAASMGNNMINTLDVMRPGIEYYLSYWDGTSFQCDDADKMGNKAISTVGCKNSYHFNPAWYAFDRTDNAWISGPGSIHWIQYDFNVGVVINKYAIQEANDVGFPVDFNLCGSNDETNWTTLDLRIGVRAPGDYAWTQYFTFINGTEYRYYRLNITEFIGSGSASGSSEGGVASVAEIKYVCLSIDGADNPGTTTCTAIMTSDNTPAPNVVSANSEYYSISRAVTYSAWKAFNRTNLNERDRWISAVAIPPWYIEYDFGSALPKVINKYAIQEQNYSGMTVVNGAVINEQNYNSDTGFPRDFLFQGSNDNNIWVTLDTRVNVDAPSVNTWSKWLTFKNGVLYRYYRIYVTAVNGELAMPISASTTDCVITASTYATIRNVVITQYNTIERTTAQFKTAGQTQTTLYSSQDLLLTCNAHDWRGVYAISLWIDGVSVAVATGPTINTNIGGVDFSFNIGKRAAGLHTYTIVATDNASYQTTPPYYCWFTVLQGGS